VDDNHIYLRVIDTCGNLVLIQEKDAIHCDAIYFQSELSSRELLSIQEQHINKEMSGTLQLKKGLEEHDFMTVQVKPNGISQYALINDFNTITLVNNTTEYQLNDIIKNQLSSRAILYGRMTMVDGKQQYTVDIISYDE
jgi:hypothetical protein